MIEKAVKQWHQFVSGGSADILDTLLADDVVFYSAVVFSPQKGKAITKMYLQAEGKYVKGVDIISYNELGQITEFKVMNRPLQVVNALHEQMREMLSA